MPDPDIMFPRQFFSRVVNSRFESFSPGILRKPEVKEYAADVLTRFASTDSVHPTYPDNQPIPSLDALLDNADPVFGTADSFDQEWKQREYAARLILFFLGIYPENTRRFAFWNGRTRADLRNVALESYYILSRFNLVEYERKALFFSMLANPKHFDVLVEGLNCVGTALKPLLPRY